MRLGKPIPTVAHQIIVKRKMPVVFIPSGVRGAKGGASKKNSRTATPAPGPIQRAPLTEPGLRLWCLCGLFFYSKYVLSRETGNTANKHHPCRGQYFVSLSFPPDTGLRTQENAEKGGFRSISGTLRAARPRWLIRFFSSGVSSATVLPSSGMKKIGS